jgi:hypothetical protein
MKYVTNETTTSRAQRLVALKEQIAALKAQVRELEMEHNDLQVFLSRNGDFQFDGADNFVMELKFVERTMVVMNQAKVRTIFAKAGKKVPITTARWVEAKVDYVME